MHFKNIWSIKLARCTRQTRPCISLAVTCWLSGEVRIIGSLSRPDHSLGTARDEMAKCKVYHPPNHLNWMYICYFVTNTSGATASARPDFAVFVAPPLVQAGASSGCGDTDTNTVSLTTWKGKREKEDGKYLMLVVGCFKAYTYTVHDDSINDSISKTKI